MNVKTYFRNESVVTKKHYAFRYAHRFNAVVSNATNSRSETVSSSFQLVYHALQLVAYTALGILIMRLKLFLTPHMCVMASLICSRQVRRGSRGSCCANVTAFVVEGPGDNTEFPRVLEVIIIEALHGLVLIIPAKPKLILFCLLTSGIVLDNKSVQ